VRNAALAASASLSLAGCARRPAAPAARPRVVIGEHPRSSVAPLYLAADAGYFAQEGVDVVFEPLDMANSASLAALIHGDIDASLATPRASVLNAIARGAKLRVVAGEGYLDPNACPQFAWVVPRAWLAADGRFDAMRLRGARARYDPMTYGAFETSRALASVGLTLDDLTKAPLPMELVPAAIQHGDVDFALLPTLQLNKTLASGRVAIWKKVADVMPDAPIFSLVFSSRLLDREREAGVRVLVAYLRAVRELRREWSPRVVDILARRFQISADEVRAECWPSFRPDGRVESRYWIEFEEWVHAQNGLDRVLKPEEFIEASLLVEANRRLNARGQ
jgi:NitT/TauT family transport system substrate-binding protein